ncbi:MAG: hydrolase [Bdellovibrionales bacterium]|nr:hydrolase [Bdellovibrionales bacterium]
MESAKDWGIKKLLLVSFFVFTLIVLWPHILPVENLNMFYIWDVGQGQWITHVSFNKCNHFDAGGEYFPQKKIKSLCLHKINQLWLSHWDQDHISFANKLTQLVENVCLVQMPVGPTSSKKLMKIKRLPLCNTNPYSSYLLWNPNLPLTKHKKLTANDLSSVILWKKWLIPGDSPTHQEKKWDEILPIQSAKVLVLGHHGSRTSTSEDLLNHTPLLYLAVASARFKKYHHPHGEVVTRLRGHGVPTLSTQDWGSIGVRD